MNTLRQSLIIAGAVITISGAVSEPATAWKLLGGCTGIACIYLVLWEIKNRK